MERLAPESQMPESQMIGMLTLEEVAATELRKRRGACRATLSAGEATKHLGESEEALSLFKQRLVMA